MRTPTLGPGIQRNQALLDTSALPLSRGSSHRGCFTATGAQLIIFHQSIPSTLENRAKNQSVKKVSYIGALETLELYYNR